MIQPLVSIGFVGCNRLYYLKSCIESFLETTKTYTNKEFFIVDNASIEDGTEEYLKEKEAQEFTVIRREFRDPPNEFAKGLNTICELGKGKYIILLQADMQFVLNGPWLEEYVNFAETNESVGCVTLDAQRNITNRSHRLKVVPNSSFFIDYNRMPMAGAGDVFYPRKTLDLVLPWRESNIQHESSGDSETDMLEKVKALSNNGIHLYCAVPTIPPAIAIYTDPRGTNARVRGHRRYGNYTAPLSNNLYYDYWDYRTAKEIFSIPTGEPAPVGIEDYAKPNGWEKMIDSAGNWLKNPIRPETALPSEWVDLKMKIPLEIGPALKFEMPKVEAEEYLSEWLEQG